MIYESSFSSIIGSVFYSFDSESSDVVGTFLYRIDADEPIDTEGIKNILGYTFARNPKGICTWSELPKEVRDWYDVRITPEERMKYKLIAQTVMCDGWLVISHNKFG